MHGVTNRAGEVGELNATDPAGIDLYIERRNLLVGGEPGRTITINGSIPGPVIRMQEGQEALIRVHNHMRNATSIHWHGILLPFNMDGVPGISFPGIGPGETFTYRYPVRQNGTTGITATPACRNNSATTASSFSIRPSRTRSTTTSSIQSFFPTGRSKTRAAC